jgi:microsomal dipeptidase-like Zn-dependent dipeptidase
MLNRREIVGCAVAAALGQWTRVLAGTGTVGDFARSQYERAVVIDALGGLGEVDPSAADDAPLTPKGLADARESGVTAINLTINDVGNGPDKFMKTVTNIAQIEHELTLHPDFLMKILRGADIQSAKESRRLGVIYGCQDTTMLDLIRHIEHAVDVCGEDHVGLGTDGSISGVALTDAYRAAFRKSVEARQKAGVSAPGESADVFTLVPEYNDPLRFRHLADDLVRRGWQSRRVEKLLGANFARLFAEVWGGKSA